jgi:DNA-binding SARP family transcriptional activator
LLWPDLEPANAARNMRVTLTHLRRLLEPDRTGGDASFHLRTDGDTIRLVRSDALAVDLWTMNRLDRAARDARLRGDIDRAVTLLEEAVGLWVGEPLPDLRDLCDPLGLAAIERTRAMHVAHLLELGELHLVADDAVAALTVAERALAVEPFDARGHRLILAAAIRGRHPVRIAAARRTVCLALRELGASPDPSTAILLRRAAALTNGHGQRLRAVPPAGATARTYSTGTAGTIGVAATGTR